MKSRSLPGGWAMSKGCSNFSFGNARTTLKGGGGSGEPTNREVVHCVRMGLVGSAADEANQATHPATTTNAGTMRERRRPRFEGDGMSGPPRDVARVEKTIRFQSLAVTLFELTADGW